MNTDKACGCKIVNVEPHHGLNVNHELTVEYCPLHAAAPELLEALKGLGNDPAVASLHPWIEEAIKRAEGGK